MIDKDLASELLARELEADLFVMRPMPTRSIVDWGKPTPEGDPPRQPGGDLRPIQFPAGSMGPKVEAACRFAKATGKRAAIGALADLSRIIAGEAGTTVDPAASGITYAGQTSSR